MNNLGIISQKIKAGGEISPLLFLCSESELAHANILSYLEELLRENHIDSQSLFHLADDGESLKIEQVKRFLELGNTRPRFAFQIFFIENISRMTTQAQNACLKFFEEPGEGNIVILSNKSEAGILETILSRVQVLPFSQTQNISSLQSLSSNQFYYSMIESHVNKRSDELVRYFFSGKYEKGEYVDFLKSLVGFISHTGKYRELLDEIEEDLNGIMKHNFQGKNIVDTYILKI